MASEVVDERVGPCAADDPQCLPNQLNQDGFRWLNVSATFLFPWDT